MFLLLVSVLGLATQAAADDRWETLRAINWVENPTNHTRMGRFGELGPYQFRPATWRMHTKKPFRLAIDREASDEVAVLHYEWIKRSLEKAGVAATPFNIAMAWNSGVDNVLNGRAPEASYSYAERVANLVQTFKRQNRAAAYASASRPAPRIVPAVITMEKPLVSFAMLPAAPRVEIALPPPPEEPVVHTSREPAPVEVGPMFTLTTTATLTPRFSLMLD
jgi:hypothetical protein